MSNVVINEEICTQISFPHITAEVILQLVDVETKEVVHEQKETNILTVQGYTDLILTSFSTWAGNNPRLFISGRRHGKNPSFSSNTVAGGIQAFEIATITPTVFSNGVSKTLSTPYLAEFRAQYNPAVNDRTIWAVGICSSGDAVSSVGPRTLVALSTPCTQAGTSPGPGQILFLTYRIQITNPTQDPLAVPVVPTADRYIMEKMSGTFTSDGAYSMTSTISSAELYAGHSWNKNIPKQLGMFFGVDDFTYSRVSNFENPPTVNGWARYLRRTNSTAHTVRYGSRRLFFSYNNNEGIGCIFGSFVYGTNTTLNIPNNYGHSHITGMFSAPAVRPSWQPVQNIFNHSSSGTEPFQQVTQLATGTGIMNATGTSWTNPNWPEYYRIQINNSGGVGTSRYSFAHRVTSGFTQNSTGTNSNWSTGPMHAQVLAALANGGSVQQVKGQNATLTGSSHYIRVHPSTIEETIRNIERFDDTSVFSWDATGVTLFKLKTEEYSVWDANTVPPLPATAIRQCSADSLGNIWVACANTGLYKINVALNTVTNYTTFDTITTSNVYAVDVGQGNRIFAMVNGGLVSSTDGGTTWGIHSFTYTGISDSNWANVFWIMIQKNSPTFRMMIGRSTDLGSTGNIVWWSTASAAGILGPTFGGASFTTNLIFKDTRCWRVSKTGDYWLVGVNNGKYRMSFGSSSLTATLTTSSNRADDFLYDYYGTPYAQVRVATTSDSDSTRVHDRDNIIIGRLGLFSLQANNGAPHSYVNFENGMSLSLAPTFITAWMLWSPSANWSTNLGGINTRVNLNQKDSPFEEFVWSRYHWNGSAWIKGYHAPALDTAGASGGPFNGTRHLFDTENHTFTGRSCIVVPTGVLTTHFTNQLTFAVRATPLAPQPGQGTQAGTGAPQQLFSWIDLTTGNSLQVFINNGSNNFVVRANGTNTTIGASPAYGGTYNIVVVINSSGPNTTAAVYIDGVQLGTTQTIITGGTHNYAAANAELVIGGNRVNIVDGVGFAKATEFFRGTMLNVLLDNIAWTTTEVSAHHAAPTTYTTANTRVRYQLNDSLSGLETKTTHSVFENLINGVQTRFTNGAGPAQFVADESYTFGVCNGILKDNATSFSHASNGYFLPITHNFTDTDLSSIPATPTSVTERVCWRNYNDTFGVGTYGVPGFMPIQSSPSACIISFQSTTGDFTVQGTITNGPLSGETVTVYFDFGVNDSTSVFPSSTAKWGIRIKADFNIDIVYNGAVLLTNVSTWTVGDTVSITRTAGVFTFFKNATLLHTTSGPQNFSGRVWVACRRSTQQSYQMDVAPITLSWNRDANIVGIGNPGTLTGKYNPAFHNFDGSQANYFTVNIAGYTNPATVTINATSTLEAILATPPAANNVIVVPDAGYMIFNSTDATKAVTVNCSMLTRNI